MQTENQKKERKPYPKGINRYKPSKYESNEARQQYHYELRRERYAMHVIVSRFDKLLESTKPEIKKELEEVIEYINKRNKEKN